MQEVRDFAFLTFSGLCAKLDLALKKNRMPLAFTWLKVSDLSDESLQQYHIVMSCQTRDSPSTNFTGILLPASALVNNRKNPTGALLMSFLALEQK